VVSAVATGHKVAASIEAMLRTTGGKRMTEGTGYKNMKAQTSLRISLRSPPSSSAPRAISTATWHPRSASSIRYLVEELAEEEQRHFDLFSELRARPDLGASGQPDGRHPGQRPRFSDCIHLPELGENPTTRPCCSTPWVVSMPRWSNTARWQTPHPPGPIHDLFRYLADEETQHKAELEKVYYEIVHSGGV
jgi:hypothetical protein